MEKVKVKKVSKELDVCKNLETLTCRWGIILSIFTVYTLGSLGNLL